MNRIIAQLESQPEAPVLIDVRTIDGTPDFDTPAFKQKPRLLAVGLPGQEPWLIDLRDADERITLLIRFLEKRKLLGHDLQTKLGILSHHYGFMLQPGNAACVMAASEILFMGHFDQDSERRPDIYACHQRSLNRPLETKLKLSWEGTLTPAHHKQVRQELAVLPAIHESSLRAISDCGLDRIWNLEMNALPSLIGMQIVGMPVDQARLHLQLELAKREVATQREFLDTHVKKPFKPTSDPDVKALLKRLKCPVPNLKDETLRRLTHPTAKAIYRFRVASRELANLNAIHQSIADGRAHCVFDPLWAETARIQSRNFNLQGVRGLRPKDSGDTNATETALTQEIRACFRAAPGKVLLVLDFKAEELRILAFLTQEPNMVAAFRKGEDLHTKTAAAIYGKSIADVSPQERAVAKQVNFGIAYGQGPKGLAEKLGIQEQEAELIIEKFYDHYESVRLRRRVCWKKAEGDLSEIRTSLGRRRWVPLIGTPRADRDSGFQSKWNRFTAFFNGEIQASGSDALKIVLARLYGALPPQCRLVMTAHDSLMIECPDDRDVIMRVTQLIEGKMLEAMVCLCPDFPFEVETKIGYTWAEMVSPDKFWTPKI